MIDPLDYYGSDFDGWYSRQLAVESAGMREEADESDDEDGRRRDTDT